jgi:tetratricopeptide (TPR) repeat protein
VIDVAGAHEYPVWTAAASCLHGAATAAGGAVDEGIARFESAIERYRALKTPPVFWPSLLQLHASVLGLAGRPDDGITRVDEALAVVAGLPDPPTATSELLLLRGQLVLDGSGDADAAEAWFRRAVDSADELDAAMLQLRAAAGLAGLLAARGDREQAAEMLAAAYGRLSEGFTTPDLVEARRLLDDLGVPPDRARPAGREPASP